MARDSSKFSSQRSMERTATPAKCSNVKLTVVGVVVLVVMMAVSATVGYLVCNNFRRGTPDNLFSTQNLVFDKTLDDDDWIVIQRRRKGNVNFTRTWREYKDGFGSLSDDFWFGNDNIHKLTQEGYNNLHIKLEFFDGTSFSVQYGYFSVSDEDELYKLTISGYHHGTRGVWYDCLRYHDAKPFSTYDKDHDQLVKNCALLYHGGWWYDSCQEANLNGEYRFEGDYHRGEMIWCNIDKHKGLRATQMMIKKVR